MDGKPMLMVINVYAGTAEVGVGPVTTIVICLGLTTVTIVVVNIILGRA